MAVLGKRRGVHPAILNSDGSIVKPRRIAFSMNLFNEGWLQKLIEDNPEVLPVNEIEPAFAPLISIGFEVETNVGLIDNLFISPEGYITIVETKLWRNPEARRQVVGQIIDYATDLSRWTYDQLDEKVKDYNQKRNGDKHGIVDSIRRMESVDEEEAPVIVDTVIRNLRSGRFLLMIVGDGIREDVEAMADYLQKTPQLLFTLALVELQVFELGEGEGKPLLVVPQIVARTKEVTRAVVRVEGTSIDSVKVEVDTEIEKQPDRVKVSQISEDAFNDALLSNVDPEDEKFARQLRQDMEERGCLIEWKKASFAVKFPDPGGSGQRLSILVVYKNGQTELRSELKDQLRSIGLPEQISIDFAKETTPLFKNCWEHHKNSGAWSRSVALKELRENYGEFISIAEKTIDRIRYESEGRH